MRNLHLGSTLRLTLPVGQTLALALVIIALPWGLAEIVARTPRVQAQDTFTSVDSPSAYFDRDLSALQYQALAQGHIDCIVLGSSMVLNGFDQASFAAVYRQQTQPDLNCVNFGVPGMVAWQAPDIARLLIDLYHPRLLILGTNARDFSDPIGQLQQAGDFTQTPWIRYRLGLGFSLDGWLTDHSYAFRYWLGLRRRAAVSAQPPPAPTPPVDLSRPPDRQTEATTYDLLAHYEISTRGLAGLELILDLPRHGVQVLLVEMPVHPTYLYFFGRGEQDQELFRSTISTAAAAHAVPFLPADPGLSLANGDWFDRDHLNGQGRQVFSTWLARQVAQAAGAGQLVLTPP